MSHKIRQFKTTSPFWRSGLLLIPLVLAGLALLPMARAVSPAPDGGYGFGNTAEGTGALSSLTSGVWNSAFGFNSLDKNTTGSGNVATGLEALFSNIAGINNTAIGSLALFNATGSYNIGVGRFAGISLTTGDNNIDIDNPGLASDFDTIRIGNEAIQTAAYFAGIFGQTTGDATSTVAVMIDKNGKLGTAASSERFKTDIKPMDKTSEAILALKPVTFHYKKDTKGVPQFGLVAEEVAKVNPTLVARDAKGDIYTVRYDAVNAMLLNEFLKEHRKVQELEAGMTALIARAKEQESQIQKVSAQLEASKPAPHVVLNNP